MASEKHLLELQKKYPQHDWEGKPYELAACKRCRSSELAPSAVCGPNWAEKIAEARKNKKK